MMHIFIGYD